MATIPFAEVISFWDAILPQADDALVNDLVAFPPLRLSEHHPTSASKTPISPQNYLQQQDWQLVNGLSFCSTTATDDGDDQWEDIDYSAAVPYHVRSFAEIAEHAGTDHHSPIANDIFLQWPKVQSTFKRHRRQQSIRHDDNDHDDESSGLFTDDLFEYAKSRPRQTRHSGLFAYRRRERVYKTKTRQEFCCAWPVDIQNFGSVSLMTRQKMNHLESKARYLQAKLDWLNEQSEQLQHENNRYRPLSKKTDIFIRMLMQELVERDKIEVLGDSDDDSDEYSMCLRTKVYWDKKHQRDIVKKQKFLQRQSHSSRYNTVVLSLLRQDCRGPMNRWQTFYDVLHDMYEQDLLDLEADKAKLIQQINDDTNRAQVLRSILKFVSLYHSIRKRDRDPVALRYKNEQIQDQIVDHWRNSDLK